MDSTIQRAIAMALAKLGLGLLLVAAVVGIRVVTVAPAGVEGDIEALERTHAEAIRAQTGSAAEPVPDPQAEPEEGDSLFSFFEGDAAEADALPERDADADRLVRCEIAGGLQFMRGADCAARGGRWTLVEDED